MTRGVVSFIDSCKNSCVSKVEHTRDGYERREGRRRQGTSVYRWVISRPFPPSTWRFFRGHLAPSITDMVGLSLVVTVLKCTSNPKRESAGETKLQLSTGTEGMSRELRREHE